MELIEICLTLRGRISPAAAKLLSDNSEKVDVNLIEYLNLLCGRGDVKFEHAHLALGMQEFIKERK